MNAQIHKTAHHTSLVFLAALCFAALVFPLYRLANGEAVALPVILFCATLLTAVLARITSHETSQFVLVIACVHLFMFWMVSLM